LTLQYKHIYNLFVRALDTGMEASLWRVQNEFIFSDNVCMLFSYLTFLQVNAIKQ